MVVGFKACSFREIGEKPADQPSDTEIIADRRDEISSANGHAGHSLRAK